MLQASLLSNSIIVLVFGFGSFSASFIFSLTSHCVFLMAFFLGKFHRKESIKLFFSLYIKRFFLSIIKFIFPIEPGDLILISLLYFSLQKFSGDRLRNFWINYTLIELDITLQFHQKQVQKNNCLCYLCSRNQTWNYSLAYTSLFQC